MRRALFLLAAPLVVALAACSGGDAATPTTTTLSTTIPSTTVPSTTVDLGEPLPPDEPITPPPSAFPPVVAPSASIPPGTPVDEVRITEDGFTPSEFVAVVGYPVVWHNDTDQPRSVHFLNQDPASVPSFSGPIPPGGTWAFVPDRMLSVIYSSLERPDVVGVFRAEPPRDPTQTDPELAPPSTSG